MTADPPAEYSRNLAGTNHEFSAGMEICSECHGAYTGGQLHDAVEAELHELEAAIAHAIEAEIAAQVAEGNVIGLLGMAEDGSDVVITEGMTVTHVALIESHGRSSMDLEFEDGLVVEHVRLGSDTVVTDTAGIELGSFLASPAGQVIAKASWNYWLLHGDGSEGVHNPSFTFDVIRASIAALQAGPPEE